jgi:hypothetical protein
MLDLRKHEPVTQVMKSHVWFSKTRTSTPVPQVHDDDQAMSSGDESDDADLTDGYSSEDDWSEIGIVIFQISYYAEGSILVGNPQEHGAASLLSFYSPIVQHYAANCALTPGFWDGAAFYLLRVRYWLVLHSPSNYQQENLPFITREIPSDKPQNTSAFVVRTFPGVISKEEDVTTTRWKCQKMNITYSPLTLPAFDRPKDGCELCLTYFFVISPTSFRCQMLRYV